MKQATSPALIRLAKKGKGNVKAIQHLLSADMPRTNQRIETSQPQKLIQKKMHALLSTFWYTQSKETYKQKEGTPSFGTRHWPSGLKERSLYRALILPALIRKTLNKILVSHSSDHPRRTNCDDRKMWIVTRSPTIVRMKPARRWISPTRSGRLLRTHLSCLFSDVTTTGECQITNKKSASEDSPENFVRVKRPLFPAFSFFRHLVPSVLYTFLSSSVVTSSSRRFAFAKLLRLPYDGIWGDQSLVHSKLKHSIDVKIHRRSIARHTPPSQFSFHASSCFTIPSPHLIQKSDHPQWHCKNIASYCSILHQHAWRTKYGPDLANLEMISVVAYKIFERNPNDYLVTSCISFILSSPVRSFTCFEVLDPVLHIANRSVLARSLLTMFFSSSQHVVQCDVALRSRNHAATRCVHFVLLASNIVLLSPFSNGPFKQSKHLFIVKTVPSVVLHFNTHTQMTMHGTSFWAFTCFPFILVYHTPSDVTSRWVSYHNNTKRCVYLPCTFSTKKSVRLLDKTIVAQAQLFFKQMGHASKSTLKYEPTRKLVRNATPVTDTRDPFPISWAARDDIETCNHRLRTVNHGPFSLTVVTCLCSAQWCLPTPCTCPPAPVGHKREKGCPQRLCSRRLTNRQENNDTLTSRSSPWSDQAGHKKSTDTEGHTLQTHVRQIAVSTELEIIWFLLWAPYLVPTATKQLPYPSSNLVQIFPNLPFVAHCP